MSKTALLVIDVQNDFVHDDGVGASIGYRVSDAQAAMPRVHDAITVARRHSLPVVFVRTEHHLWTDDQAWTKRVGGWASRRRMCEPAGWGAEFFEIEPLENDPVVTKHRYSAFVSTNLDLVLRSLEVSTIACCGFAANVCVESSLRHGYMLGFNGILLADATAGTFGPEELTATIHNVEHFFGTVTNVGAWEKELEVR